MYTNTVIYRLVRTCMKSTTVKGIKIEKGMEVNIPTFAMQRDPDFWENPLEFVPERCCSLNFLNIV